MLFIALYLCYILLFMCGTGHLASQLLNRLLGSPATASPPGCELNVITDDLVLGIAVSSTFLAAYSLFAPIGLLLQIVVSCLVLVVTFPSLVRLFTTTWNLAERSLRILIVTGLPWPILWALYRSAGPVGVYDTGTYHLQAVRWTKEYGSVPGLANLFGQLGFNSHWHVLWAFFDHGAFDGGRSFHVAGLVPFAVLLGLALESCARLAKGDRSLGTWLPLVGCPALTYYYKEFLASLGTDMPAATFVLYALVRAVQASEQIRALRNDRLPMRPDGVLVRVAAASSLACTVKLSAVPALALPFVLYGGRSVYRARCIACALVLSVLLPHFLRNVVLTGHLLYPAPSVSLSLFDWAVPVDDVAIMKQHIKEFAIVRTFDCDISKMQVEELMLAWLRSWSGASKVQALALWLFVLSPITFVLFAIGGSRCFVPVVRQVRLFFIVTIGLMFCLSVAPEPRFLGVWALPLLAFVTASVVDAWSSLWSISRERGWTALFVAAFMLLPGHESRHEIKAIFGRLIGARLSMRPVATAGNQNRAERSVHGQAGTERVSRGLYDVLVERMFLVSPPPIAELRTESSTHGVRVFTPALSNRIWYAPLPACQRIHPFLQLRGVDLHSGFRVTEPSGWKCLDPEHQHRSASYSHW